MDTASVYRPAAARRNHSLARANGWGSASECPAPQTAKTLAVQELVSRVAAASDEGASASGTARRPTRGAIA